MAVPLSPRGPPYAAGPGGTARIPGSYGPNANYGAGGLSGTPGGAYLDLVIDNQTQRGGPLLVNVDRAVLFDPGERRPDPYVEIRVGGDKQETRKIKNSNTPYWGEQLVFQRVSPNDVMQVTVKDSDFGKDDRMGNANIPLASLPPGPNRKRIPLQGIDNTGRRAPTLGGPGYGGYPTAGYGPPVGYTPRARLPPGVPATNYWLDQDPWQTAARPISPMGGRPPTPPLPPPAPTVWNGYNMDGDWDSQRKFDSWYSSRPIHPDPVGPPGMGMGMGPGMGMGGPGRPWDHPPGPSQFY